LNTKFSQGSLVRQQVWEEVVKSIWGNLCSPFPNSTVQGLLTLAKVCIRVMVK